jgi:quercetin dioxygenase-like cupin family protein
MPRCGDMYENKVTGEKGVVLRGDEDGQGQSGLANLIAAPGAAVVGEHVHPHIEERFRVVSGELSVRVGGIEKTLVAGEEATAAPGVAHDWWNAGKDEASVLVEVSPPDTRFVDMLATLWGLANAGKTNSKGMPNPLQLALIGREFEDVIQFTKPPRIVQQVMFALLAPIGRWRGYRATYPEYLEPHRRVTPDPEVMALAGLSPPADPEAAARL